MKPTIYASFVNIEDAERATGALLDFGLVSQDISLVGHEQHKHRAVHYTGHGMNRPDDHTAVYTSDEAATENDSLAAKSGLSTTTGADAAVGAEKGAGIGLGVGVAAALAAMFIPGIGLVVGGGTLALALAGAAATTAGGAIAGGALGYLKDQGVPEHVVSHYNETLEKGGAVLAISLPDDVSRSSVDVILNKYNALNINEYNHPVRV